LLCVIGTFCFQAADGIRDRNVTGVQTCALPISEEQKEKYLKPLAEGKTLGAFGLTEPNAGSDAGGTQTTATLDGQEFIINGEKCFITNASYAKTFIITDVTGKVERGQTSIVAIILPPTVL